MNPDPRRPQTLAVLLLTAAAALTAMPGASAHDGTAYDPAAECGPCDDGQAHDHRDASGNEYCHSDPPPPPPSSGGGFLAKLLELLHGSHFSASKAH